MLFDARAFHSYPNKFSRIHMSDTQKKSQNILSNGTESTLFLYLPFAAAGFCCDCGMEELRVGEENRIQDEQELNPLYFIYA